MTTGDADARRVPLSVAPAGADADLENEDSVSFQSALGTFGSLRKKKIRRRTVCAICCSGSVVCGTVVGLIGFFVFGPMIAKNAMANSVITFDKLNMTRVVSSTSIMAKASITVNHVAPLGCDLAAMDVTLMYKDKAFGSMQMPAMTIKAFQDNHRTVDETLLTISDIDTWNEFSSAMLREETLTWRLKADASMTAGMFGMSVTFNGVPFDKEIPLTCFNGMKDDQMEVFDMSKSTPGKLVVSMSVCIKNPSNIVIADLGQLFFGIYYEGSYMGNVSATQASMLSSANDPSAVECTKFGAQAYNAIKMVGSLHPANHSIADELISRYFSGKVSQVSAHALAPTASSLPLFNTALQGLMLNTALDGDQNPLITGLDVLSMIITPIDNDQVSMKMQANVHIADPLGDNSSMQISEVDMLMNMSYGGAVIGTARTGATTVPAPNTVVGHGTIVVPASITTALPDRGVALTKLSKDLILKKTLTLDINGASDTLATCSALGYPMHVKGVPVVLPNPHAVPPLGPVVVAGMDGLSDVVILGYTIPGIVPDGTDGCISMCGALVTVQAKVENPSNFGMLVGTMNANLENSDGVKIGTVTARGLTLKPGSNIIDMTGKIAPADTAALSAAESFFSNYLQNKAQPTKVVGTDAGDSTVEWLQNTIKGLELKTTFPGAGDGFSVMKDIDVQAMFISLSVGGNPQVSATIGATMQMPAGVDISIIRNVDKADMQFDMIDSVTGRAVGGLSATANCQYADGKITASFAATTMTVKDPTGFGQLMKELLLSNSKVVQMKGIASPHAITNMGAMQLSNVPFAGETTLRGFNAFAGKMKVLSIDVTGGHDGLLDMVVDCEVTNPSNVAAAMGEVSLQMWTGDNTVKLGDLTIVDFSLKANAQGTAVTRFPAIKASFRPPAGAGAAAGRLFLSNFVQGNAQTVIIRGTEDSTPIPLLKPAMAGFLTSSSVPGLLQNRLLLKGLMHLPGFMKSLYDLPTQLIVQNPFSAEMQFVGSSCDIYPCKTFRSDGKACLEYFAESTGKYTPDTVDQMVPGKGQSTLPLHPVKLYKLLTPEMIETAFKGAGSGSFVHFSGSMTIAVGGTQIVVDYTETAVPICLVYPFHKCNLVENEF